MTRNSAEDLDTILDRLIAHPDQLEDVRQALLRKLDESRKTYMPRVVASRSVEEEDDFFDNVPV